jgi:ABC-2 type transport system permease protein
VILVVFGAMLRSFLRDRGALVMSFVLPLLFFLVFAAIFASATGEHLRLRIALADEVRSPVSTRLLRAVARDPAVLVVGEVRGSGDEARALVRGGTADLGLIVRAGAEPLGSPGGFGPAPLLILVDPTKAVAGPMLTGLVQRAYFSALPDVALGGVAALLEAEFVTLEAEQKQELRASLEELRQEALAAEKQGRVVPLGLEEMFESEPLRGPSAGLNHVAYSAGAVAVLFLLFSAVQGALSLIEEREGGILDRVLAGPAGTSALLGGKLLFLISRGLLELTVIFAAAWLVHGVDLPGHLPGFAVTSLAVAAMAAGLALLLTTACRSRRQAQTVANVVVLIVSAVGGSMVPRFFMPPLLQELGWLTPTTWALEAYTAVFWRDEPLRALSLPLGMLLVFALVTFVLAVRLARRWERV